jgi:heme O synthase-like polyprenyltransferase
MNPYQLISILVVWSVIGVYILSLFDRPKYNEAQIDLWEKLKLSMKILIVILCGPICWLFCAGMLLAELYMYLAPKISQSRIVEKIFIDEKYCRVVKKPEQPGEDIKLIRSVKLEKK